MTTAPHQPAAGARATVARQRCIDPACNAEQPPDRALIACPVCGSGLDVVYDWPASTPRSWSVFEARSATKGPRPGAGETGTTPSALDFSGVWRFRELLPFWMDGADDPSDAAARIVTLGEGRTNLQRSDTLAGRLGIDTARGGRLYLQYEGFNPSGSFKDNGMAAAFTHARMVGARRVACASTGNTSASLALYASLTGIRPYVFIGEGRIAFGKLAQALDHGAATIQVAGDFDACLRRVREIATDRPELGVYLMNSVNPFRLEGQKTIMCRVLEGLDWEPPDWIVVPGGNLGNCSAFGKAFAEMRELGLIDRVPRLAVINAAGAGTLDRIYNNLGIRWENGAYDRERVHAEMRRMDEAGEQARTVASAIEINRPVNLEKALRALETMDGVVRAVDDHCILEHKALVGLHGFGCEPASGASVAGARRLIDEGVIRPDERVVCILTGHALKDPDATVGYHTGLRAGTRSARETVAAGGSVTIPLGAVANRPVRVQDDMEAIVRAMDLKREDENAT